MAATAQKRGIHWRRIQRKLICTDPQRPAILARIRAIWRHLPPEGHLLFFDVKPVVVKAYGGARYTSARRLVLGRHQKTRGRFYLFLVYDVGSGKARWRSLPGKDSTWVCRFMRLIRRWYPDGEVWVILDQDSPHPRKSRRTRRTMRELDLHYVSLPKGCPDDNAAETVFSPVQTLILDSSNDPDAKATRRRIGAYLRGRNRRDDPSDPNFVSSGYSQNYLTNTHTIYWTVRLIYPVEHVYEA